MADDQKNTALFFQLIMSFQAAAMQQMGKLKNPFTDTIEKDLQQAQMSIDMIEMIRIKTENNRNEDETKFLEQVLRDIRLNYIDELNKDQTNKNEKSNPDKNK